MDLRRVRYFVAVAEYLHFGRAAERMNVVQPAISQQIKRFEEELGTDLFERSGNEVRLTEAGRQMLPECIRLLEQAEEAVRVAKAAGAGTRGRIRFGFVDNSICALLPPLVREFRRRFPDVEMNLEAMTRAEQSAALLDRRLDVGLMPGPLPKGDFESETFVSAPLMVALPANHRLASHRAVSLEMLTNEPFVLFPASMRSRVLEIILAACAAASFTPYVTQEATQMHTLLALVDAGLGVTLVPRWVARGNVHQVVFRPIKGDAYPYELIFAWHKDPTNPALEGLREVAQYIARSSDINSLATA